MDNSFPKTKKILIFSLAYHPFIGGAEVAIKEITERLSKDFSFDLITLRFDKNLPSFERLGNVNVYRVGFAKNHPSQEELLKFPMYLNKVFYPVFACLKAISLYRKNGYDFFWAMMSYAGFPVVLFRMFYKKVSYVLTLQEGDDLKSVCGRWRIRLVWLIFKKVFKDAAYVQTISNYLACWAEQMGAKNVLVIPNGINAEKFNEKSLGFREEIRRKYAIAENERMVITTGRLVQKNGVGDLIKSITFLPAEVKLLIVGDGPLLFELQKLSSDLQLGNRVVFSGFVPQEKIREYLAAADVFCRPSLSEGMGNSFIEAMASGVPVVATPVGGIPDFLKDKETGLFCGVRDPNDIAHKISILLRDKEISDYVVKNAMSMVKERYDWNRIAKEIGKKIFDRIS